MSKHAEVGVLDPEMIPFFPAIGCQAPAESTVKSRIDVNGHQFIPDGDSLQTFAQRPHEKEAVHASAQADHDPVATGYHVVPMNGLAHRVVQLLIDTAGMLLRHVFFRSAANRRSAALFDLFILTFSRDFTCRDLTKRHHDIFIFR